MVQHCSSVGIIVYLDKLMTCIVRFDISYYCEYCNPSVDVISVFWVDTQGVKGYFLIICSIF